MTAFDAKIKHYNLNLFYSRGVSPTAETNLLIQKIINNFINQCKTTFASKKIFILEYQDDLISLINYRMLYVCASIVDMKILLLGKHKKTKKQLVKKQKFVSTWKAKRLIKKGKAVYISAFNPLYKVVPNDKIFNILGADMTPLESFTYENLCEARLFYHIGYVKNDILDTKEAERFNEWCNNQNGTKENTWILRAALLNFIDIIYKEKDIHLIKLSDDLKLNEEILQSVQDLNGIFIYDINNSGKITDEIKQQLISFSYYLKNSSNTYGYLNDRKDIDPYKFAEYTGGEVIVHGV